MLIYLAKVMKKVTSKKLNVNVSKHMQYTECSKQVLYIYERNNN